MLAHTFWSIWVTCGSTGRVVFVWPAIRPAILRGKDFNVGHYTHTFQQNVFIRATLVGTINFYHLLPTLTLPAGHKVSNKKNILALFLTHFSTEQDEIWYGKMQFKLNILMHYLFEICRTKGNNWCFADCVKKNNKQTQKQQTVTLAWVRTFMNRFGSNFVWW